MRRAFSTLRGAISDYAAGAAIAIVLTALARRGGKVDRWGRAPRSLSA